MWFLTDLLHRIEACIYEYRTLIASILYTWGMVLLIKLFYMFSRDLASIFTFFTIFELSYIIFRYTFNKDV